MSRLRHAITSLLKSNQTFALYFQSGKNEPELVVGKTEAFLKLPGDITRSENFVFAPYAPTDATPIYLINNDKYAIGEEAIEELVNDLQTIKTCTSSEKPLRSHLEKKDYEAIVQAGVNQIKENPDLEKIVLSRSFDVQGELSLSELLPSIKQAMPKALCYLVHIPEQGIWLGATPEKLLDVKDLQAQTNALAGTLPIDSDEEWSEKEIDEQQIVTDYIAHNLDTIGITDYKLDGPKTYKTGAVRHLNTVFDFQVKPEQTKLLIETLHPTPAVCGMPKQAADQLIAELEPMSREYYSGYLGPLNINNESHIFVNLRCMKVAKDKATLFVGAGITVGSIPHKEWEETEVKALTLLNVIRK